MTILSEPIPGQSPSEGIFSEKRPRNEIEADLRSIEDQRKELIDKTEPIREQISALPGNEWEVVNNYIRSLDQEGPEVEPIELPKKLIPLAKKIKDSQEKGEALTERQLKLEMEMVPYRKEDLIELANDLSERIDYDAVFNYYRGRQHSGSTTDLIENTVDELFRLRRYQFEMVEEENGQNFNFYDRRCLDLEESQKAWQVKGFLKDSSHVDEQSVEVIEGSVTEERRELVRKMEQILANLDTYRRLTSVYQFKISHSYPFDAKLDAVYRIINVEGNKRGRRYENFEEIGFDPRFVQAAIRHVDQVVTEHQNLGHLPSDNKVEAETQSLEEIEIRGLDSPKGMLRVVTAEEIETEIQDYLPPSLLEKLRAVVCCERPDSIEDEEGIETVGGCRPFYDEESRLTAVEVEVYWSPYLPEDSSMDAYVSLRLNFLDTLWHELGHNSHHLMRFEELAAWEKVMAEDDVAVSRYVTRARNEDKKKGKREDFSETFSLFVSEPARLEIISPARFGFMLDFFDQRLSQDQKKVFQMRLLGRLLKCHSYWKKKEKTPEDIRREHLAYLLSGLLFLAGGFIVYLLVGKPEIVQKGNYQIGKTTTAVVSDVIDGDTFKTGDAKTIRLANIEARDLGLRNAVMF
jgi:hypothetical protein